MKIEAEDRTFSMIIVYFKLDFLAPFRHTYLLTAGNMSASDSSRLVLSQFNFVFTPYFLRTYVESRLRFMYVLSPSNGISRRYIVLVDTHKK